MRQGVNCNHHTLVSRAYTGLLCILMHLDLRTPESDLYFVQQHLILNKKISLSGTFYIRYCKIYQIYFYIFKDNLKIV